MIATQSGRGISFKSMKTRSREQVRQQDSIGNYLVPPSFFLLALLTHIYLKFPQKS